MRDGEKSALGEMLIFNVAEGINEDAGRPGCIFLGAELRNDLERASLMLAEPSRALTKKWLSERGPIWWADLLVFLNV